MHFNWSKTNIQNKNTMFENPFTRNIKKQLLVQHYKLASRKSDGPLCSDVFFVGPKLWLKAATPPTRTEYNTYTHVQTHTHLRVCIHTSIDSEKVL